MHIKHYTLKVKGKTLLRHANLYFTPGVINHIVGKNGVGKSQLAKDLLVNNSKQIRKDIWKNVSLISSSSNIPHDISKDFLIGILKDKFGLEATTQMIPLLHLDNIDGKILISQLSDGQKQKLKLLSFFLENKRIIILDEITNSLDKKTIMDIHHFLRKYIQDNPNKIIINITHNLADLKTISGKYYMFHNQEIEKFDSVDKLIETYIND